MKRTFALIMSLIMFISSIPISSISQANEEDLDMNNKVVTELIEENKILKIESNGQSHYLFNKSKMTKEDYKTLSTIGAIAIFVLGVLVGYLVDGVIIYLTGKSAGEWTADALRWATSTAKSIFCNSKKVLYGKTASGCIIYGPNDTEVCTYFIRLEQ